MSRILLVIFLSIGSAVEASAQKYRTAAGVRIGRENYGLTIQQKILPKSTLEGIAAAGEKEISGTVLFEQHFPVITRGLNYYIGAGAHVGNVKDAGTFYGGDAILGLEAKLLLTRLLFSIDLKPAFHVNHENWVAFQGGFSIRYILIKDKKKPFKLFGKEIFGDGEDD